MHPHPTGQLDQRQPTDLTDITDLPPHNSQTSKPTQTSHQPLQANIKLAPGSHASEAAVNKQLADKERVAAALENPNLLQMVDRCLAGGPGL